ncbi:MAG: bifunctional riboflavin kinase/FAD synthetase [Spirochaetota bacterium]|nr:bifunctional riboflavin kinase/FAD synthetase [Spirochaetota bacterium]
MRIYTEISKELKNLNNQVITIGSFDGVHIGHQKILSSLLNRAKEISGEAIVLTFNVPPRKVLFAEKSNGILTSKDEKIKALNSLGIETVIILDFSREIANISAIDFINEIKKNLGIVEIVAGYDHAFGKDRKGDIDFLKKYTTSNRLGLTIVEPMIIDSRPVSSTWIRSMLEQGNIDRANKLLGRRYTITGEVVKGVGRGGSLLGFPTANIKPDSIHKIIPSNGVYAVTVEINERHIKQGMLNIGTNPTFDGESRTVEVNIFDFDDNIYGKKMELRFHKKMREERKFDSPDDLIKQLEIDKLTAINILN